MAEIVSEIMLTFQNKMLKLTYNQKTKSVLVMEERNLSRLKDGNVLNYSKQPEVIGITFNL